MHDALEKVGLTPVETFAERYPHQLSGGQRQRVAIAGSLVLGPSLLVADEPVSMLDVSVRAGILQLLDGLRRDEGVGILMITHDLATAAHVSDRVAVMYHGNLVELGPARTVIDHPKHPYTQALIYAVPRVHRDEERVRTLPGEPPDASPRAVRLPLPPALPALRGALPARGAGAAAGRRRPGACWWRVIWRRRRRFDHDEEGPMRVSIGDVSLWFDVLNPGLVTDGPVMREKPVLLALHGGPGFDHTDFKGLIEPLCDDAQVVLYDHRANGRSDDCDQSLWNLEQWADDVHAFCAALGIERPFVLGWSFGGMVAQVYAARYPDELAGLVLLSTAAQLPTERSAAAFERVGGAEARDLYLRTMVERDPTAFEDYLRVCMPLYTVKRDPRVPERPRDASDRPAGRGGTLPLGRGRGDGPAAGARAGRLPDAHPERPSRPDHAAGVLRRDGGGARERARDAHRGRAELARRARGRAGALRGERARLHGGVPGEG